MTLRCVVLDDHLGVALTSADWSVLPDVDVTVLREHVTGEALVDELGAVEVLVIMRERTPLTRELLERLPSLRLLVTTGRRNASIDLTACAEYRVVVSGTRILGTPTPELTWALILGLVRHLPQETAALRSGGPWQSTRGPTCTARPWACSGWAWSAAQSRGWDSHSGWMSWRGVRT